MNVYSVTLRDGRAWTIGEILDDTDEPGTPVTVKEISFSNGYTYCDVIFDDRQMIRVFGLAEIHYKPEPA